MKGMRNRNVVQVRKSPLWNAVLVYNEDKTILEQLPIDREIENKLHGRCKMYCICHRDISGGLVIEQEVKGDW